MIGLNGNTRSLSIRTAETLTYRAQPNHAIHAAGLSTPVTLTLVQHHLRHEKQLGNDKIAGLNSLPDLIIDATAYCACYAVDGDAQQSRSHNHELVFQPYLYLFSMLIAFEWQPSAATVQQVQFAAKQASDFLYDVTDGCMALGQVILSGPELLDVADIQVMASNRFHPRAWNGALLYPQKYQPIRVGRGLWRKDHGFVLPWDESDAYHVLVHEWGHYALALADEYLDLVRLDRSSAQDRHWQDTPAEQLGGQNPNSLNIVAPSIALPVDSIMATLASSELVPRHAAGSERRAYTLRKIQEHFPRVAPPEPLEGPAELPLPDLPLFPQQQVARATPEEVRLPSDALGQLQARLMSPGARLAGNCWVYVLKPDGAIIGQGIIGTRDWEEGFTLLGAAPRDQVVVVAQTEDPQALASRVWVLRAGVCEEGGLTAWDDATPNVLPTFIDVLPEMEPGQEQLPTRLRVQIEASELPSRVLVAPLGQTPQPLDQEYQMSVPYPGGEQYTRWVSQVRAFHHLDGHVLLSWENEKLYICNYSHGGGPCTSGGGRCASYTAGSYEGNSMVFYLANYDASDSLEPALMGVDRVPAPNQNTRIVSTVIHGGPQYLGLPSGDYAQARSYIFSLGSNQPFRELSATLVLYYDNGARKRGGDLLIYRWAEQDGWQPLTTYAPEDQPYLCIPFDQMTPETSSNAGSSSGEYFDRYRIYWTPHT